MLRRSLLVLTAVTALSGSVAAIAQAISFFRIGTAGTGGMYYPVGGLIAEAISAPPGALTCDRGGSCGVPGMVASAVATKGSVANIMAIRDGRLESALVQGDVAYWAQGGTGIWHDKPAVSQLRAIANLYPESLHLVTRAGAGIASVADLRGKRVSLDVPGSGTRVDARLVLDAAGIRDADLVLSDLTPNQAAARMADGQLDAFFFVGGYPATVISQLASHHGIHLVPIDGALAQAVLATSPYFVTDAIPAQTYDGQVQAVPTLSVGAQWVTLADQPEALIHDITRALWSTQGLKILASGHSRARAIQPERAIQGLGIPLHPGAMRYYREAGLLN